MSLAESIFLDRVPFALSYDYIIYTDGTNTFAFNTKTKQIDFVSTEASEVIQSAINEIALIGGKILFKPGTYDVTGYNIIIPLNPYKPIKIAGINTLDGGVNIRSNIENALLIDGSLMAPSKWYNIIELENLNLGLALRTQNIGNNAWTGRFKNITISMNVVNSNDYGVDLTNFFGYIKDSLISIGNFGSLAGNTRLYYTATDADILIDHVQFNSNPAQNGVGRTLRIESNGNNPTNLVLNNIHTTTPGGAVNEPQYGIEIVTFSAINAYNLYLEGYTQYGLRLNNVIRSYFEIVGTYNNLGLVTLLNSSVNTIISHHDIVANNEGGSDYNIITSKRLVNWDLFSPSIGVNNTFGPAYSRSLSSAGQEEGWARISNIIVNIGGTLGTGETITVQITTVDPFGNVNSIQYSATSTGTFVIPFNLVQQLNNPYTCIRTISVSAKTNLSSTSATVNVSIYA